MTALDAAGAMAAIDGLIAAARSFHERGWMLGTSGNLSARLDSGSVEAGGSVIAITGSGASKGALGYADVAVLPEESRDLLPALGAAARGPSAESAIHRTVYERLPEVGAVFHVHTVASTALSRAAAGVGGAPRPVVAEGLEMLKGLGVSWRSGALRAEIPVLANRADMGVLAEEVGALLDRAAPSLPALLVAGHGLTVWGATIEQTRNRLEAAEFICEVLWSERARPPRPSGLPPEGA